MSKGIVSTEWDLINVENICNSHVTDLCESYISDLKHFHILCIKIKVWIFMLQYETHTMKEWMFQNVHIYFWVLKQTGPLFYISTKGEQSVKQGDGP